MKNKLSVVLSITLLIAMNQVQATEFSSRSLQQAADAYLKPNDAFAAMQQLERQDNGFVPLMLARCLRYGISDCPKDLSKSQIYAQQESIIQQQLQQLAQHNHAEAYNWLGNIERDNGTQLGKEKALQYFEKSAALNNAYAMSVIAQMYDTSLNGFLSDDRKAVEWYQKASNLGDITSMINIGVMYENGRGVTKNEIKAVEWYQKAANLGDALAMNNLGRMFTNGKGVAKDERKAVEWYQKAANLDNAEAMNNLGRMFADGKGVAKDERKAVEWYQKAANLDNADAMDNLGKAYEKGLGVLKDERKAVEWYQKAATLGNTWAMKNLAEMYYFGRGGLQGGMPASVKWYQKSSDLGNSTATSALAFMYTGGWGVPVDYNKAVTLYNKAIEQDGRNAFAFHRLGTLYAAGSGVPLNVQKAIQMYEKAVDLGSTNAMTTLATHYMNGNGLTQNVTQGLSLYQKAIDQDDTEAMNSLAIHYLYGIGVEKDQKQAFTLLQRAIVLKDWNAYFTMATMYRDGLGIEKDPQRAMQIYRTLADAFYSGSPRAMLALGEMYRDGEGVTQDIEQAIKYFKQPTRFSDYRGILSIGYMYEQGKGVTKDYNKAAEYYLQALEGDTYKRSSAKTYLADLVRENKITSPHILRQAQSYFNPAPSLSWLKQPNTTTDRETIDFSVNVKDTGYGIGDVRLFVDGIPVDQKGRDFGSTLEGKEQRDFSISLPKGRHTIRVEANNAENLGLPTTLEMQIESNFGQIRKPKLHAIVIGVDQFKNDDFALKYAVADANAVYTQIKNQVGGLYEEGSFHLLTSQQQTSKQNIQTVLAQVKEQARLDDIFVFYVASHGTTFDDEYYMLTSDALHTSKERVQKTAFSTSELQNLFVQVPASKKIVFMDTCNSGGGIDAAQISTRDVMQDQKMIERMRERSGVTVLMASGSEQKALEGYQGHGVFTYAILQALAGKGDSNKDGFVDSTELVRYVEDLVPDITKREFQRMQTPFTSMAGQSVTFKVQP